MKRRVTPTTQRCDAMLAICTRAARCASATKFRLARQEDVRNTRALVLLSLLTASAAVSACRRTYVVVPRPATGYSSVDTLYGRSDGRNVRVTFHFDTTFRVDTVVRVDTAWRGGTRILVRVDTVRVATADTVYRRIPTPTRVPGVPTTRPGPTRTDTVRVTTSDTVRVTVNDTVRITVRDTIRLTLRDTVVVTQFDTVVVTRRDTLVRRDTVRITGRRVLFVPPGQYPPAGQCRVWIHDRPPGQQARPAPCDAVGDIPDGAFILFGGEAWDADYDWVAEARRTPVPAEIITLTRRRP